MPRPELTPEMLALIQRHAVALPVGDAYETADTILDGPAVYQLHKDARRERWQPPAPEEPDITEQWFRHAAKQVTNAIEAPPPRPKTWLERLMGWLGL